MQQQALLCAPLTCQLYYTVAAPFNVDVCRPPYCTIHRMDKDGSGVEVFASGGAHGVGGVPASGEDTRVWHHPCQLLPTAPPTPPAPDKAGIRNAAGLAFHPASGDLLFAGMERDLMGNDRPDDILAALPGPGLDLQWPYCHWLGGGAPELRLPGPGGAIPDPQFTLPAAGQPRPTDAALAQQCAGVLQGGWSA